MKTLTFNQVYAEQYKSVLGYVNTRVWDKSVAEELTNDVFMRVAKHLPNYNPELSKLRTWIFTIANNIIIDYIRATKNETNIKNVSDFTDNNGKEFFQFTDAKQADSQIIGKEMRTKMLAAINKLSKVQKNIILLFYFEQKQLNEITEILNISLSAAKVYKMRAIEILQNELKHEYATL